MTTFKLSDSQQARWTELFDELNGYKDEIDGYVGAIETALEELNRVVDEYNATTWDVNDFFNAIADEAEEAGYDETAEHVRRLDVSEISDVPSFEADIYFPHEDAAKELDEILAGTFVPETVSDDEDDLAA